MKYPCGTKKIEKTISHANRGMSLESEINKTNEYYLTNDIAVIHKKPVSITINKVEYKSRCDATIKEAYFKTPSTTDYNGLFKGKYVDFEAKETKSKTSFNLNNIHKHQIRHLELINKHGGIGFLIIRFTILNRTYLIFIDKIIEFMNTCNRKSIPLDYIDKFGYIIKDKYNPTVDYLEIINNLFTKEKL